MISITELSKAWVEITSQSGLNVGRRADPNHPLDFFITYDENHNIQLMLISDFHPVLPDSSQQILVRGNQRADGRYAVCFSLSDNKLRDQFVCLCWDILDCTYNSKDKRSGTANAIKRFCMWQKLFAEAKIKRLSDTEIKGLIGELIVLKSVCISRYGPENAVAGWIGPMGADRDFEFSDYWYESKYVSLSNDNVSISSFDQLDTDNPGFLLICRIEKSAPDVVGSFSLNSLIESIFSVISNNDNAVASLKNKLSLYGYEQEEDREDIYFILHQIEKYVVDVEFPRIRRSTIHTAIADGAYELSILALQIWRQDKVK